MVKIKPHWLFCPYKGCIAKYRKNFQLITHIRIHNGDRPFECDYVNCDKKYIREDHLRRHKLAFHAHKIEKSPVTYLCKECNVTFKRKSLLRIHSFKHSGEKPFKCSMENCEKSFLTPSKLRRHQEIHLKLYQCKFEHCLQVFSSMPLLRTHYTKEHKKEFHCPDCILSFGTEARLKCHQKVHQIFQEKFQCMYDGCNRYYRYKRNLSQHIRLHHQRQHYICSYTECKQMLSTKQKLKAHERLHEKKQGDTLIQKRIKSKRKDAGKPQKNIAEKLSGVNLKSSLSRALAISNHIETIEIVNLNLSSSHNFTESVCS